MTRPVTAADAQTIAGIASKTPGVVSLAASGGAVATYLPGARVHGVRIEANGVSIHLLVDPAVSFLPAVADAVRTRVRARYPQIGTVDVCIDDLVDPTSTPSASPNGGPAETGGAADAPATDVADDRLLPTTEVRVNESARERIDGGWAAEVDFDVHALEAAAAALANAAASLAAAAEGLATLAGPDGPGLADPLAPAKAQVAAQEPDGERADRPGPEAAPVFAVPV